MAGTDDASTSITWRARALIAYGVVASACWWLDREYTVFKSGSGIWALALVTSLGQLALGLLVHFNGERFMKIARYYQVTLILGMFFVAHVIAPEPNVVTAFSLVAAASLLTLLWGSPGKPRAIAGYVLVAACILLQAIGTARRVG